MVPRTNENNGARGRPESYQLPGFRGGHAGLPSWGWNEPHLALEKKLSWHHYQPESCTASRRQASFSTVAINKRTLIKKILTRLTGELEVYHRAALAAHAEATHEQNKAENKYDTRGLEASYLAHGQSRQAVETKAALAAFETLVVRKFRPGEPVDLGAVVELELRGERSLYFIGPKAGGTEVVHDGREILVITPRSPLGEQLQGKKAGDHLQLSLAAARDLYRVISIE